MSVDRPYILHFSPDRSLGTLYHWDSPDESVLVDQYDDRWWPIDFAIGDMTIPPGKEIGSSELCVKPFCRHNSASHGETASRARRTVQSTWKGTYAHAPAWRNRFLSSHKARKSQEIGFIAGDMLNEDSTFTDEDVAFLHQIPGLSSLDFQSARVTETGLAGLEYLPAVRSLSLPSRTTDEGFAHIHHLSGLRETGVPRGVSDDGMAYLQDLIALKSLGLAHNTRVTDDGFIYLKNLTALEYLSFGCTNTGDAAVAHVRHLTNLRSLALFLTKVTDDGLRHLRLLTKLRFLGLSKTAVSDDGLTSLQPLIDLEELHLEGTRVTDAGLAHLVNLQGLRHLFLKDTQVSDPGATKLRRSLPALRIFR